MAARPAPQLACRVHGPSDRTGEPANRAAVPARASAPLKSSGGLLSFISETIVPSAGVASSLHISAICEGETKGNEEKSTDSAFLFNVPLVGRFLPRCLVSARGTSRPSNQATETMAEVHGKVDEIGSEVSRITAALRGFLTEGRVSDDRKIKTVGTQVVQGFLSDILARLDRVNTDLIDVGKLTSTISPLPPAHDPTTPLSYNSPPSHQSLPLNGPPPPPPSEESLDQPQNNQQAEQPSLEQHGDPHHQLEQGEVHQHVVQQQEKHHHYEGGLQQDAHLMRSLPQIVPQDQPAHVVTVEEPAALEPPPNLENTTERSAPQHSGVDQPQSQPDQTVKSSETSANVLPTNGPDVSHLTDAAPPPSQLPEPPVAHQGARLHEEESPSPSPTQAVVNQDAPKPENTSGLLIALSNRSVFQTAVAQEHAAPLFDCTYRDVHKLNEEFFERCSSHSEVKDRGYFKLQVRDLPPLAVHEVSRPGKYHATSFTYQVDRHGLVKVDTGKRIRFKPPHLPFPSSQKRDWTFEEQKELWNSSAAIPPEGSRPYIIGNPLFEDIELHPGEKLKRRGRTVLEGINTQYVYFNLTGKTITTMHREDAHVRSENLLRSGEHKFWCFIKPAFAAKFEERMQAEYPEMRRCSQAVRHLSRHIPPSVLDAWGIEYTLDYCYPGQAVVTEPGTYHQVLNLGPNYALAVNVEYESSPDDPPNYRFCDNHCPDKFAMKADDFHIYDNPEKWAGRNENNGSGARSSMAASKRSSMTATKRSSMAPTKRSSMTPGRQPSKTRARRPSLTQSPQVLETTDVQMTGAQTEPSSTSEPAPESALQELAASSQSSSSSMKGGARPGVSQSPKRISEQAAPVQELRSPPPSKPVQSVTPPPEQTSLGICAPPQLGSASVQASSFNGQGLENPSPVTERPQEVPNQQQDSVLRPPVVDTTTPLQPAMATPAPTVPSEPRSVPPLPAFLQRPVLYTPIPERPEPLPSSALSNMRGLAPPPNFLSTPSSLFQSPARSEQQASPLPVFHSHHLPSSLSAPPSVPATQSSAPESSAPAPTPYRKTARILGNKRPAEGTQYPKVPKKPRVSKKKAFTEPRFEPKPQAMEVQSMLELPGTQPRAVTEPLRIPPPNVQEPVLEPHFVVNSPLRVSPAFEQSRILEAPVEGPTATRSPNLPVRQDPIPGNVLQLPQMALQRPSKSPQQIKHQAPSPTEIANSANEGQADTVSQIIPRPLEIIRHGFIESPPIEPLDLPAPPISIHQAASEVQPQLAAMQLNDLIHSTALSRFTSSSDEICGKPAFERLARLFGGWRAHCRSSHVDLGGLHIVNHVEEMSPDDNPELHTFLRRFCQMKLAETFEQMAKALKNSVTGPEDATNEMLTELDWDDSQRHMLHDYLREGKCWITLTNRFEGLLPLLPLSSDADAFELALFNDQVKDFQKLLKTEFVRKLCSVGKTFQDSIWNCLELPEFVFETAYRPWFTVQQIMPMLKTFTLLKETFYDEQQPYHWGLPPQNWSLFWGWPTNPVAVPSHVKWCDADTCRRRTMCKCASRLIPEVPRISINGPKGRGIRAVGVFEKGEILGELTGELVPAGMFSGGGSGVVSEWTWEVRRPDVRGKEGEGAGSIVAEIWPRERGNWVRLVPHDESNPCTEFKLKKLTGKWRVCLIAMRRIGDGEEIKVRYGAGYLRDQ